MVRNARVLNDGFKDACELCGAHLAGNVIVPAIVAELSGRLKPSRGDGGDPCSQVGFQDGDFAKQIYGRLMHVNVVES